jgi:two-component system alkaline phosphatase synthesis response regulator PhoP
MSDKKVLVVDDEVHIVQVVAIKLRNNGYNVVTAENGSQGYDLARQEKPDVVISDFQMPVMTGLELVEKMRQDPDLSDVPVIMLTARGFSIEEDKRQTLKLSACLSKPFSPREVLQCVEEVTAQKATT